MIVVYLKLFSCQIDETWNFQSRHLSRSGRVSVYVCVRVYFWAVQTNCSHMRLLCVNNIGNIIENRSRKMHSTPLSFDRDQSILGIGYGAILNAKWQMVRNGYVFAKARKRESNRMNTWAHNVEMQHQFQSDFDKIHHSLSVYVASQMCINFVLFWIPTEFHFRLICLGKCHSVCICICICVYRRYLCTHAFFRFTDNQNIYLQIIHRSISGYGKKVSREKVANVIKEIERMKKPFTACTQHTYAQTNKYTPVCKPNKHQYIQILFFSSFPAHTIRWLVMPVCSTCQFENRKNMCWLLNFPCTEGIVCICSLLFFFSFDGSLFCRLVFCFIWNELFLAIVFLFTFRIRSYVVRVSVCETNRIDVIAIRLWHAEAETNRLPWSEEKTKLIFYSYVCPCQRRNNSKKTVIKINRTSITCYLCHCKCFCRLLSYTRTLFGLFVWHNSQVLNLIQNPPFFTRLFPHKFDVVCIIYDISSLCSAEREQENEVESEYIENKFDWKNESIE